MKKKGLFTSLAILSLLGLSMSANADLSVTNHDAPTRRLKRGTTDKLVMDFTLKTTVASTSKITDVALDKTAITFRNIGTADNANDILNLKFWYETAIGEPGFNGDEVEVGTAVNYGADPVDGTKAWVIKGTGVGGVANELTITETGVRCYVTVSVKTGATESKTVRMRVPLLKDDGATTGKFDDGEAGIFVTTDHDGPSNDITNTNTQTIDPVITVGNIDAPGPEFPYNFPISDTAKLVMEFTMQATVSQCNVNAITFRNITYGAKANGPAGDPATTDDITLKVWYDDPTEGDPNLFEPEFDEFVGTANAYPEGDLDGEPKRNWRATALAGLVLKTTETKKVYVTATIPETNNENRYIYLSIPEIQDTVNVNGSFDTGEVGIFVSNSEDGPVEPVGPIDYQTIDAKRPYILTTGSEYWHDGGPKKAGIPWLILQFSEDIDYSATSRVFPNKIHISNDLNAETITLTQAELTLGTGAPPQGYPDVLEFQLTSGHQDSISAWEGAGANRIYAEVDDEAFRDHIGNRASAKKVRVIWYGDFTPPDLIGIRWGVSDTLRTIFGAGDTIEFEFTKSMNKTTVTSANVSDRLKIKTAGHHYGASSGVEWDIEGKKCCVILGNNFKIEDGDEVDPTDDVTDLAGNPDNTISPYPTIEDDIGPLLWSIGFLNMDGPNNTELSQGDKLVFNFSERMKTNTIPIINVNTRLLTYTGGAPSANDYKCTALSWNTPEDTRCTVTLGANFTVRSNTVFEGDSVQPTVDVKDYNDNPVVIAGPHPHPFIPLLEDVLPGFIRVETYFDEFNPDTFTNRVRVVFSEPLAGPTNAKVYWKVNGETPNLVTDEADDTSKILRVDTHFGTGGTPLVEYLFGVGYTDSSGNYLEAYSVNAADEIPPYFTGVTSEAPVDSLVWVTFSEPVYGTSDRFEWLTEDEFPRDITFAGGSELMTLVGAKVDAFSTTVQYQGSNNHRDIVGNYVRVASIEAKPGTLPINWVDIDLKTGWNMVSVPVIPTDPSVDAVFPGHGGVYTYTATGYDTPTNVAKEEGYWVYWPNADETIRVEGSQVTSYTKALFAGWNMIGSLFNSVPAANAVAVPDLITPPFYWYDPVGGYAAEDPLIPGHGYWIYATGACNLTVSGTKSAQPTTEKVETREPNLLWDVNLKIENEGTEHTLKLGVAPEATQGLDRGFDKLLPPPPPSGKDKTFDAHFDIAQGCVTDIRNPEATEWNIVVNSNATIGWNPSAIPEDMIFTISAGDKSFDMSSKDHFTTDKPSTIKIVTSKRPSVPKVFALSQNTPNPFTGNTTIKFQIPVPVHTSLTIYNMAGQSVKTLVNEDLNPGYYALSWNGRDNSGAKVGSGVYFCKLQAGKSTAVRKIMLME